MNRISSAVRLATQSFVVLCVLASSELAHGQESLPDAALPNAPGFLQQASSNVGDANRPLTITGTPRRIFMDELHVVSSPAHVRKDDLKWLLPLAGATAASLATDTYTMRHVVSRNPDFNDASGITSDGIRDTAIGVPVLLFALGSVTKNDHSREAGLLAGEAMLDAYVTDEAIKYVTFRERPALNDGRGHFYAGDAASDPSFVSGHTMVTWSSAAVLAAEYSKPWQQAGIYTLASGVSLTRVLAQQHFPTDALLGSAAGWLMGHYVYRAHHRHR